MKRKCGGLFDNVFWRHQRSDSCGIDAKPSNDTATTANVSGEYVVPDSHHSPFVAMSSANKRNSFSSPDLSNANHYENHFHIATTPNNSLDSVDGSATDTADDHGRRRNVSEDIISTYNMSCNLSTVNLVGAKLNDKPDPLRHRNSRVIEDVSGYCAMAPVFHRASVVNFQKTLHDKASVCVAATHNNATDDSGGYIEAEVKPKQRDSTPCAETCGDNVVHSITVRRDYDDFLHEITDRSFVEQSNPNVVYTFSDSFQSTPPIRSGDPASPAINELNCNNSNRFVNSSPSTIQNDDKYPSYYPNQLGSSTIDNNSLTVAAIVDKIGKKQKKSMNDNRVARIENVYVESPQKTPIVTKRRHSRSAKATTPSTAVPLNSIVALTIEADKNGGGGTLTSTMSSPLIVQSSDTTPRLYKKYATLARITPNRYGNGTDGTSTEKTICDSNGRLKKSDIGNSLKRFASLPRFRKIDFSPLKMKLNSVLHRHNTDNI